MSDINVSVSDVPIQVNVSDIPIQVTVSSAGVVGGQGPAGINGTVGITGLQVTGSNSITGLINIVGIYGTNVILSGDNIIGISGGGVSAGGGLSQSQADLLYLSTGSSGQFYSITNLNQYITSGDVSSNYYTKNNESGFLNTLSGLSNSYVTGISGALQSQIDLIDTSNFATITNLFNTGSNLYNSIIGLSGQLNLSGSNLQNQINSINTFTGNQYKYKIFATSGVETEFISYPILLSSQPIIGLNFENDRDTYIYSYTISGVGLTGFYTNYSDYLTNSGYKLNITLNL